MKIAKHKRTAVGKLKLYRFSIALQNNGKRVLFWSGQIFSAAKHQISSFKTHFVNLFCAKLRKKIFFKIYLPPKRKFKFPGTILKLRKKCFLKYICRQKKIQISRYHSEFDAEEKLKKKKWREVKYAFWQVGTMTLSWSLKLMYMDGLSHSSKKRRKKRRKAKKSIGQ